jgi:ribosome-binding protein aMBF1 (putative translation factor)
MAAINSGTSTDEYISSFAELDTRRFKELEVLIAALANFSPEEVSADKFTVLFQNAVSSLEISEDNLAKLLHTNRSTINRWTRGKNAPTRLVRKAVVDTLKVQAEEKIKYHKPAMREVA